MNPIIWAMMRQTKTRQGFFAEAMHGAVIDAQPECKSRTYGYRLNCKCGWTSELRQGQIDAVPGAMQGRFDCESCRRSNVFTIREDRGVVPSKP